MIASSTLRQRYAQRSNRVPSKYQTDIWRQTLPDLLKSAVASSHTLIFVPSYFDFVRLNAHLKNIDDLDYAVLSEYSSTSEISRARTNFFNGKKAFLVVTERFHFFRRWARPKDTNSMQADAKNAQIQDSRSPNSRLLRSARKSRLLRRIHAISLFTA